MTDIRAQLLQILAVLERHPDIKVIGTNTGTMPSVHTASLAPLMAAYPAVAVRPEPTVHGLFRYMTIDGVEFCDLIRFTNEQLSTLAAGVLA